MILKKQGDKYKLFTKQPKTYTSSTEEPKIKEVKKETPLCTEYIAEMLAYISALRIAHWEADTVTNEHRAIGDLYDSLSNLLDDFAEMYLGKYGMMKFPAGKPIPELKGKPVQAGLELVKEFYGEIENDEDLKNVAAEMEGALNKAKYLLKEK